VKFVLNVTARTPHFHEAVAAELSYSRIAVEDSRDVPLDRAFASSAALITQHRRLGAVLVHCLQGRSRSVTVLGAYLMRAKQWSLIQTAEHLGKRHVHLAKVNEGFQRQLMDLERELFGGLNSLELVPRTKKRASAPPQRYSPPMPRLKQRTLDELVMGTQSDKGKENAAQGTIPVIAKSTAFKAKAKRRSRAKSASAAQATKEVVGGKPLRQQTLEESLSLSRSSSSVDDSPAKATQKK